MPSSRRTKRSAAYAMQSRTALQGRAEGTHTLTADAGISAGRGAPGGSLQTPAQAACSAGCASAPLPAPGSPVASSGRRSDSAPAVILNYFPTSTINN